MDAFWNRLTGRRDAQEAELNYDRGTCDTLGNAGIGICKTGNIDPGDGSEPGNFKN